MTEDIRQKFDDQDRERQLSSIYENDPWVFSPEGIRTLAEIRKQYPHVNAAKNHEWSAAYDQHLANEVKKQRLNGKVSPNPTGLTAKAPPTPVGPAPRAIVQPKGPDLSSKDAIDAHVASLDDKGMREFFGKHGLKFR